METLKRCYPELLKYRINLYNKLADVKVDYSQTEKSFTLENLLNIIDLTIAKGGFLVEYKL